MTETRVIIDANREATPEQMVVLQDGVEVSIDHIVGDTLVPDRGYAGMLVSVLGTVVTVGAGRLFNGGKVYAFDTATTFDMQVHLATATKRQVLIVAYGIEDDTDVRQISVLIEAQSTPAAPVFGPQALPFSRKRLAIVQAAYGDEAPNPAPPPYGLALPVAQIVLGPAGILSCVNLADGKVPVLKEVADRTTALETWEAKVGPQISSIASDLAALANSLKNSVSQALLGRMLVRLADLDAKVGIPSTAADSSADYLLAGDNSDLANPLSNCKVMEGVRFADDNASDAVLDTFNPFETAGVKKGGVLFAAYDRYLRTSTGPATGAVSANSFTYNPVSYTLKTISRERTRYGVPFTVCTNSAFWNSLKYDPVAGIFKLPNGEAFLASTDPNYGGAQLQLSARNEGQRFERITQFWKDTWTESYWTQVVQAPVAIPGYHLAETVLIGQDQWLPAVGFTLPQLDNQGDVTVIVCEAGGNAAPDPSATLSKVTIPFAALVAGRNIAELPTPVLLSAGKRISIILVTGAAHRIATTDGPNFPQGTFFVLSPSGYAQGDLTKHLCLELYGCKFRQSVASIQLQNLQLAGGMTSIDILAGTVKPGSTSVIYEIQLAGLWVPLSADTVGQLNAGGSMPPNVPLRVTLAGTPDMMPALDLAHSNVHVSRPKTNLVHIWPKNPRLPPVPSSQIRVIERFESWDPLFHTAGCQLLTGVGLATVTNPSSFSDVIKDDGALERTSVFNLGAAVTAYKVKTAAGTTSALKPFHGAWIKDWQN